MFCVPSQSVWASRSPGEANPIFLMEKNSRKTLWSTATCGSIVDWSFHFNQERIFHHATNAGVGQHISHGLCLHDRKNVIYPICFWSYEIIKWSRKQQHVNGTLMMRNQINTLWFIHNTPIYPLIWFILFYLTFMSCGEKKNQSS